MVNHEDSQNVPPMGRPYKIDVEVPPQASYGPLEGATPVTFLIIAINVVVFLAMAMTTGPQSWTEPSPDTLFKWGGDVRAATLTGDYWRAFTCMFVHAGIVHLGMNMYVFQDVGRLVERLYGSSKFLVVYLIAGLGGSVVSLLFTPVVSVGASGAVFGTFGAFLAILKGHADSFEKSAVQSMWRSVIFLLVFNLIWGFSHRGTDNAAHIGGFITGVLAGSAALPTQLGDHRWTTQNGLWIAFVLIMVLGAGYADYLTFVGSSH